MATKKTAEETAPVTFYSKYAKLRVVVVARTRSLIDGRFVTGPGKTAEFDRGQYSTADPEIIEFLRNDPAYGTDFFENQADMAATVQEQKDVNGEGEETTEVAKPVRRKKGEKATVAVKPTTADDLDAEEGSGADDSE